MQDRTVFLIVAAVAGFALYKNAKGSPISNIAVGENDTREINNPALPGEPGYGWRYFSNGIAIDPLGNYYDGGEAVGNPMVYDSSIVESVQS